MSRVLHAGGVMSLLVFDEAKTGLVLRGLGSSKRVYAAHACSYAAVEAVLRLC